MKRGILRTGIWIFWIGACTRAQTPIRADSANVVVDVRVYDAKGRPVTNLSAENFRIFENGAPQKLVACYPPARGQRDEADPVKPSSKNGVGGSATSLLASAKSRFVSLVIDQANTQPAGRKLLVKALHAYTDQDITANSYISVYAIGAQLRLIAPFTQDKHALQAAIDRYFEQSNDATFTSSDKNQVEDQLRQLIDQERRAGSVDETQAEIFRAMRDALQQAAWAQIGLQARSLYAGLRAIAHSGSGLPGKKTIVLFSEGFGHAPDAVSQGAAVIDAANRANTTIYAIDPAGVRTAPVASATDAQYSTNETSGGRGNARRRVLPNTVNEQMKEVADSARRRSTVVVSDPFDHMRHIAVGIELSDITELAESTGGFVIQGQNDLRRALNRIDEETTEAYTLVYSPETVNYDGKFRNIRVEATGGSFRLRYRTGYWAIAPAESEKLTPAAAQILASIALGTLKPDANLKMNAALLFGASGGVDAPLSLEATPRVWTGMLVLTARDRSGKLVDAAQRNISEADKVDGKLQIFSRLTLPAFQDVQLTAILQFADATASMATCTLAANALEVPSTTLVLTDRVQPAEPVETAFDALKVGKYQLILPAENSFDASGPITIFAQLETPRTNIQGNVIIRSAKGVVHTSPMEVLTPLAKEKRYLFLRQLRLDGLEPGAYTADMRIEDGGMKPVLVRSTAFTLRR